MAKAKRAPIHAGRAVRQRAPPPKLVTLGNALLAALHPESAPDPAAEGVLSLWK